MHKTHRGLTIVSALLCAAVLLQGCGSKSSASTTPEHIRGTIQNVDGVDGGLSRNDEEFHVICRKSVAPYILDLESTRPFSGALVHDLQALLSARKKIIFSPLAQGDDYREQLAALLGQDILLVGAAIRGRHLLQEGVKTSASNVRSPGQ